MKIAAAPEKPRPDAPAGVPSAKALRLASRSRAELETALVRGTAPALDSLAGWEFRGLNQLAALRYVGIRKFIKGFYLRDGELYGYNCPAVQNRLEERWIAKPDDASPKRYGFYKVLPVDPTAKDNAYLHSLLLDYGRGGNPRFDVTAGLRDYLVQVSPDDPDLLLGKAYFAVGPLRVPLASFFILERHRRGLSDVSFR